MEILLRNYTHRNSPFLRHRRIINRLHLHCRNGWMTLKTTCVIVCACKSMCIANFSAHITSRVTAINVQISLHYIDRLLNYGKYWWWMGKGCAYKYGGVYMDCRLKGFTYSRGCDPCWEGCPLSSSRTGFGLKKHGFINALFKFWSMLFLFFLQE